MRRVDHQLVGLAAPGAERGEDAVEHAKPTPADEPVVDRFVRTTVLQRVSPAQAVADNKDDPTDHPTIIDPRHPVRQRKM